MLLLIHPSGGVIGCNASEGDLAKDLILDGWEPVGPRGKAAAAVLRAARDAG